MKIYIQADKDIDIDGTHYSPTELIENDELEKWLQSYEYGDVAEENFQMVISYR